MLATRDAGRAAPSVKGPLIVWTLAPRAWSMKQFIGTRRSGRRMLFHLFTARAEFERFITRECKGAVPARGQRWVTEKDHAAARAMLLDKSVTGLFPDLGIQSRHMVDRVFQSLKILQTYR